MLEEKKLAGMFKALGDENRIKILKLLQSGEKCACVLLDDLHITQPTLSHHMKILCDSEIVVGRKEGKWTVWKWVSRAVKSEWEPLFRTTYKNDNTLIYLNLTIYRGGISLCRH